MAIAFHGAIDGGNAAATSHSFSFTVGSGSNRALTVAVLGGLSVDNVTGVTYNGAAATLLDKRTPAGTRSIYLFGLLNPTSGANTVAISTDGTDPSPFLWGGASDYDGVATVGLPDAHTNNYNASTASLTTTLTTIANNCWTVIAARDNSGTIGVGAGTTERARESAFGTADLADSNGAITPAGSTSLIITGAGGNPIYTAMASLAPFVGGGAAPIGIARVVKQAVNRAGTY